MRPRKSVGASLGRVRRRTNLWTVAAGVLVWPRSKKGFLRMEFYSTGRLLPAAALLLLVAGGPAAAGQSHWDTLHNFCSAQDCTDGASPLTGLTMDASGNLYGATPAGGDTNNGTIYELIPNADRTKWKYRRLYSFCADNCSDGSHSTSSLIVDSDGNLYGTRASGGANNGGFVFELIPNARRTKWKLKTLHDFCSKAACADGLGPNSGLTYAGAGSGSAYDGVSPLYGRTQFGGNQLDNDGNPGFGVAYELTHTGPKWKQSVLYTFCSQGGASCTDGGAAFHAGVAADASGNLFGVTGGGGTHGAGVAYELSLQAGAAWHQTVLYDFCALANCADGGGPDFDLIRDADGNLFGVGAAGGAHNNGVVFKIVPDGVNSTESVLHDFCSEAGCHDGAQPSSSLTMDSRGDLFGLAQSGSGQLFKLGRTSYKVLHTFCSKQFCRDGLFPNGNTVLDGSGNLFLVTSDGGRAAKGVVFEYFSAGR